ncbi:Rho termination factor N-terminal domain-containing protein [Gloeocapsopsis crepidinum LEGE 06123]|uniref:Rho termination factor N-terminal domain-containing protein n=1 Tax=Gloeocapsopsis crepidinum LEGE 06123 TaxID=588587 RepID=A0ABR9UQS1_9CHRO|nr:Rho termination factor N-terminal domain-containing protein [Gloeocapsopsis crepidinum]MBE9190620.1 Rho termination factor N-terminal domain-containing protein [Gloeocapsopsis crepidinum LEGE 06123]
MDATQVQALLTLSFNTICIAYTTLVVANFVCGLCEEWMKLSTTKTALDSYEGEVKDEIPKTVTAIDSKADEVPTVEILNKELGVLKIRELKKLASQAHIKGYGSMTKQQLIQALA